jgi:uncharacterized protein
MRIVMAGASGFLGSHLRRHLAADGHDIVQLIRREPRAAGQHRWWPDRGELDPAVLTGADAVVNLAGAALHNQRWTPGWKRLQRTSRVGPTSTIATALATMPADGRPTTLVNGSGVGYYGDTGDRIIEEDAPPGRGYFPELAQVWEAAAAPAQDAGVRVVRLRTGLPLARGGGLLGPLGRIFGLGVGGTLGSGRQWMPWISMPDWLAAVAFLLVRSDIAGPVNCVGPAPARNTDFTRALARAVRRPAILPTPAFAIRLAIGEYASEALGSHRVVPAVLNRAGFDFRHTELEAALRTALHPAR